MFYFVQLFVLFVKQRNFNSKYCLSSALFNNFEIIFKPETHVYKC